MPPPGPGTPGVEPAVPLADATPQPAALAPAPPACPNCATPLAEPPPRFCPHCGQETRVRPPTLGEFVQQLGGAYLSTEGALWRTLALLFLRPGELTRQYLAGRRKHYVLPLRLYLTISVVVLLAARLAATVGAEAEPGARQALVLGTAKEAPRTMVVDFGSARFGRRDGIFFCEQFPRWICQRVKKRLDVDAEGLRREAEQLGDRMLASLGPAMFLMLPLFAAWLKLAYLGRGMRYTEHLVFALHLHAFWFIALALALAGLPWLSTIAGIAVPVYALMAMKRVYGGRLWPRLARAALVSVLYGVSLLFMTVALVIWAFVV